MTIFQLAHRSYHWHPKTQYEGKEIAPLCFQIERFNSLDTSGDEMQTKIDLEAEYTSQQKYAKLYLNLPNANAVCPRG